MNVKQISIFIQNKPGHLQNVLKILAEADINIITLTIAEINDFGIIRLIVNSPEKAQETLKKVNIASQITEVLALEIGDEPGSLYNAMDTFSKADLNIEYMYAFTQKVDDKAVMIFRFDDIEAARNAALAAGHRIVSSSEITGA